MDYNTIPVGGPLDLTVHVHGNAEVWGLRNFQGVAQSATTFSAPHTEEAVACSYNNARNCCSYTATIGGNPMPREFELISISPYRP
jgi:hypothetical protein